MIRYFIKFMFVCFMCVSSTAFASEDVRAVTLTWTGDVNTTQTISWQTTEESDCYLAYRELDQSLDQSVDLKLIKAKTSKFVTDERVNFIHVVNLENLKPGTVYTYKIGKDNQWVKIGQFQTATGQPNFKFLLFSDSQSYNYKVWQNTFEAAYLRNQEAKFYVVNGDLVDNGQKQKEWDEWFSAVEKYANQLPVVPVVGNHETYTPYGKFSLPVYFTEQFELPTNGPESLKKQVYSFDYGNVHFVVLDTQFGEERGFIPESLQLQKEWLENDLARSDKKWKVVFMHRPIYHNRIKEQGFDLTARLAPVFDQYGVDVVFTGHDHVVARTDKIKDGVVSVNGTVYVAVGRSGTKTYDTVDKKSWDIDFLNPVDQPVYDVVTMNEDYILIQIFRQNGEFIDQWQITK